MFPRSVHLLHFRRSGMCHRIRNPLVLAVSHYKRGRRGAPGVRKARHPQTKAGRGRRNRSTQSAPGVSTAPHIWVPYGPFKPAETCLSPLNRALA